MEKKNFIFGVIAIITIAILSATFFFACEEKDVTSTNSNIKKTMNNEDTIIGFYNIDEQAFELNFSEEEFAQLYEDKVKEDYDIDVHVELVRIYDEQPENPEYYSYLQLNIYNIDEGYFLTNMIELSKDIEGNNRIYYAYGGPTTATVSCKGTNCEKGCIVAMGPNGQAIGCTKCENEEGKCETTSTYSSTNNPNEDVKLFMSIADFLLKLFTLKLK
jgi:hypothetical protein